MIEPINQEGTTCVECGAARIEELTCWEQLGAILAWEIQDPEWGFQLKFCAGGQPRDV